MKVRLIIILFVVFFGGCAKNSPSDGESLTVSAAVSLKEAFNEIAALYQTKTGKTVSFNFGASGALQRQIETGAPVDLFASAGERQMDELAAKDLIDKETRRDFARNSLVLIVPNASNSNIKSFTDLAKPEVQKIAVGNPKTVPAGQYTEQVFDRANLKSSVQSKLILAEDARQVLDYVVRGEVDAGIVYASDARSADGKVRVAATAPEDTHSPVLYPIAVVKDSRQKQAAQEFVDLILSAEGQNILQKYGFAAVSGK
jgi:molybdate transport system substrate-binding protein